MAKNTPPTEKTGENNYPPCNYCDMDSGRGLFSVTTALADVKLHNFTGTQTGHSRRVHKGPYPFCPFCPFWPLKSVNLTKCYDLTWQEISGTFPES